ncbi:hypothetical protein niasHT_038936 [Heterodera trifolii]|uniref:DUF7083 domain-containing protein n=1 Tax=Heterodera trifolii TaxID=157864 RepID=A0ABD2IK57_9BILA
MNCALANFGRELAKRLPFIHFDFEDFVEKNKKHCGKVAFKEHDHSTIGDNNTPARGSHQLEMELFGEPLWNYAVAVPPGAVLRRIMANQNATIQQLMDTLAQQQQLVQQLLTYQTQNVARPVVAPTTIPALPDIMPFEQNDDKARVTEWISRFKFALDCAAPNAADEIKLKALMNKLSEAAFSEYSRSVLPSAVTDFNFDATVQRMEKLFARPQSIFIGRYECLKAVRSEGEDFRSFINRHRKLLADFKFSELNKEQFKCLMLLTAFKSQSDSALRQRILAKLSADGTNITYNRVVEDLINFQATIVEAKAIEASTNWRNVNAVNRPVKQNNSPKMQVAKVPEKRQANKNCWRCGAADHWGSEADSLEQNAESANSQGTLRSNVKVCNNGG